MGDSSQPKFLSKALGSGVWEGGSGAKNKTALITGAALDGSSLEILKLLHRQGFKVFCSDIKKGKDVDFVWDLENKPDPSWISSFDLVVSCSVLEHVRHPGLACINMMSVLKSKGLMYVSVPWIWRYHKYPDDYHRFHASTLNLLFKNSKVIVSAWSTSNGRLYAYKPDFDRDKSTIIDGIIYMPYLMIHEARVKV